MATSARNQREFARRADERAYHAIWSAIQEGRYRSGDRLFEEALAKELEVSRTPVRAALVRLGFEGIVEFDISGGARVVQWSERDITDAFTLRTLLEKWATAQATRNMTPEIAEHLSSLVETQAGLAGLRRNHSVDFVVQFGLDFHETIAEASENAWLVKLRQFLIRIPMVDRIYRVFTVQEQEQALADHKRIIEAMLAGDESQASLEMERHLDHQLVLVRRAFADLGTDGEDDGDS